MFEVTTRYTRRDTNTPFWLYQTTNNELALAHLRYRNDMLEASGFIGISYVVSENKMMLDAISLWESEEAAYAFRSVHRDWFIKLITSYNRQTGSRTETQSSTVHDTKNLKLKKLSSRITATEAGQYLKNFITTPL